MSPIKPILCATLMILFLQRSAAYHTRFDAPDYSYLDVIRTILKRLDSNVNISASPEPTGVILTKSSQKPPPCDLGMEGCQDKRKKKVHEYPSVGLDKDMDIMFKIDVMKFNNDLEMDKK